MGDATPAGAVESPSAYEHLLLDALRGDPTCFARGDEVEAAWEIVQPVLERWEAERPADFPNYKAAALGRRRAALVTGIDTSHNGCKR